VLDVVGDGNGELKFGSPPVAVEELNLHRSPERFHGGVVVAVPGGPHGADQAEAADVLAELPGGELGAVSECTIVEGDVDLEAPALVSASLARRVLPPAHTGQCDAAVESEVLAAGTLGC
jgi:hypothetical protein